MNSYLNYLNYYFNSSQSFYDKCNTDSIQQCCSGSWYTTIPVFPQRRSERQALLCTAQFNDL